MSDKPEPRGSADSSTLPSMRVDWGLAVSTARRLGGSGPDVTGEQAKVVVAELRDLAFRAQGYVAETTGLRSRADGSPVLVVDRAGWAQANAELMDVMLRPLLQRVESRRGEPGEAKPRNGLVDHIGSRVAGVEAGVLLGFLSGKVLGQFDPFYTGEDPAAGAEVSAAAVPEPVRGRLLLVAPNLVQAERALEVPPQDFRLWVCLHEETHRVQFTAVPWLRDYLISEIEAFLAATPMDVGEMASRVWDAVGYAAGLVRSGAEFPSLLDLAQTAEQREVVARVGAVMSLLEGHADVVMDEVGPAVVPTVALIRERFEVRRDGSGGLDRILRRLLGLDAKTKQYRDGAVFVREVSKQVGLDGFNAVWTSPQTLPTPEEIAAPQLWVTRVHG